MTRRSDIPHRLIYTCHCGWVDKGHALAQTSRPHVGATSLWRQIVSEKGERTTWPFAGYRVIYQQDMYSRKLGIGAIYRGDFLVADNLSHSEKESVALGIFLFVSFRFEALQWFGASSSSFSEEDLVSNLIGFYKAVRPHTNVMTLCEPVSASASFAVWDSEGGLGKNRSLRPVFHPCTECNKPPRFPAFFRQIVPAPKGKRGGNLWRDWQGRGFGR